MATGAAVAAPQAANLVEQGRYLSSAGDCEACHTAANGAPFAGGYALNTPFGTLSTPNITPDKATGIGNMTDDQFYRVMHDGIGSHGQYLYQAMPYPWYTRVTRDDVMAIKAYLFSLKPVHHVPPPNHLEFPFNVRQLLFAWREVFFKPGTFQPDPQQSAEVNRGAYLVNGLGHCGECHNSRLLAGDSKHFQKRLQGGAIDGWYAPNITSDVKDGIGAWSDADIATFLKTGAAPGKGIAVGPMAEAVHSLSGLSDEDLHAVAAYLKSTPAVATESHRDRLADAPDAPGAQAYLNNCASCHGTNGQGQTGVPPLANNGSVAAKGPENVLQVVLGGLPATKGYAPMLAIGAGMDDKDVADVANYVRQQWGNHAPPTASANMVYDLRSKIDTPMTAGRLQGCAPIAQPAVAKAVANAQLGIASRLDATNIENMAAQVPQIVSKTRAAAPGVQKADLVNGLTAAYCQVVRRDAQLDWNQRALQLGQFSELLYLQISSNNGLVAAAAH